MVAAPFALLPALGLALARPPEVRLWLTLERSTALENDELSSSSSSPRSARSSGSSCCSAFPTGSRSSRASRALSLRLGWDDERTIDAAASLHAVGELPGRATSACERGTGFGLLTWETRARPADAPPRLPAPGDAARDRRAGLDAAVRGQPGRAAEGRRARVRRPARVRSRRPRPLDQLAGERPPQRARRQRAPSRAERRRDSLPRHVRRRACRRTLDPRSRRPRDRDARLPLSRAP